MGRGELLQVLLSIQFCQCFVIHFFGGGGGGGSQQPKSCTIQSIHLDSQAYVYVVCSSAVWGKTTETVPILPGKLEIFFSSSTPPPPPILFFSCCGVLWVTCRNTHVSHNYRN